MFNKRQCHVQDNLEDPIVLTGDDDVQLSRVSKCEVASILLNETAWLTCTIMEEARQLLKSIYE